MAKILKMITLICVCTVPFLLLRNYIHTNHKEVVNVYGWYGIIPNSVIRSFEKETNIKVIYDVYDNNDTLEAKLLATNRGYDIVFPSFIPYAARQSYMGIYKKLDYSKIPNIKNISSVFQTTLQKSQFNTDYLIPFFWGTIGIAINKDIVYKLLPNVSLDSYDIIFNPKNLKILAQHGVSFPEEFIDIFPQTMTYLDKNPHNKTQENLSSFKNLFRSIRQYITKFSSTTIINDLLTGNICIGIGSSDNVFRAMLSREQGAKIKYILPSKGGILWIDCLCIPKTAPHLKNAYKFINFLLRPDICQQITNYSKILVTEKTTIEEFRKQYKNFPDICPNDERLGNMMIGTPSVSPSDLAFDKMAIRIWTQIRLNDFEDYPK